jgi:hypothetical protein
MEDFKKINDFPNYLIYNDGRIFSIKSNKFIKPWLDSKGRYYIIGLCKNNIVYKKLIHRLVAEYFINNPLNLPEVNHKDYNTINNKYTNLEWVNRKENMKHCFIKNSPIRNFKECILYKNNNIIKTFISINDACKYAHDYLNLSYSTLNKYRKVGEYKIITKG